jgi:hypothetical protein
MMTRKQLVSKLEARNSSEVLVHYGDYRHCHPVAATPLQKWLAQILDVESIEARHYVKKGREHSSPKWLVDLYRRLVLVVYAGNDILVRTVLASM